MILPATQFAHENNLYDFELFRVEWPAHDGSAHTKAKPRLCRAL